MDLVRRLENLAIVAMPIGAVIAGLSQYVVFPGSNYFGNYLYIGGYSLLSDSFAGMVEDIGNNLGNKMVQKIGRYYNEITISLLATYFVLSETIIDWVPT